MTTSTIIAELNRARSVFQLRAVKAAMGWPYAVDLGASRKAASPEKPNENT